MKEIRNLINTAFGCVSVQNYTVCICKYYIVQCADQKWYPDHEQNHVLQSFT